MRIRTYEATVLILLLFGSESWALKKEDRQKLEACHHKFLRSMLGISMLQVKDQHIKNSTVRQQIGSYSLEQSMELRARSLEKLSKMPITRNPAQTSTAFRVGEKAINLTPFTLSLANYRPSLDIITSSLAPIFFSPKAHNTPKQQEYRIKLEPTMSGISNSAAIVKSFETSSKTSISSMTSGQKLNYGQN